MATIHIERYVCPKAESWNLNESRREVLRQHYYSIRALLTIRERMAAYCPEVAAGRARERLAIRPAEFTIDHRPVALRFLLAECHICPDPEAPEPSPGEPAQL